MRLWLTAVTPSDQTPETLFIRGVNDRGERIAAHLSTELSREARSVIARMSRGDDLPVWRQEIVAVLRWAPLETRALYHRAGQALEPAVDALGNAITEHVIEVSAIWPLFDLDSHHACAHCLFGDGGMEFDGLEAAH